MLHGRTRECERLDRVLAAARSGESQVLIVRGEAGVGKTALLEYLREQASGCRVVQATGIESEMELAFAGLHQLCAPMLDLAPRLPVPQQSALATAFGQSDGDPPDRFLVALAVLSLLAEAAEETPLICLLDDVRWLDEVSAQTLSFVARRLLAERVAMVFAGREESIDGLGLAGLPELVVRGLSEPEATTLLESVIVTPLDARVRSRIIAEARGNPLALLELPRTWTSAELVDGFDHRDSMSVTGRMERGFEHRLDALPDDSRRLLLVAAAEPLGDPMLLWNASRSLGIDPAAAAAAESAGLIELGARVHFRHPMVRAAAYRRATLEERHEAHRALAEATDPTRDADRRAWHRAQATASADEEIAAELVESAERTKRRGGLAAAGALLARAAELTPAPDSRAGRALAAATVKREAGALDAALALLAAVDLGPSDPLLAAEVVHLRGQIAFDQRRAVDAANLLTEAGKLLDPLDADLARETYLEALAAAMWASGPGAPDVLREVAGAARAAAPAREPERSIDVVLDALATRITEGYEAAVPLLSRALEAIRTLDERRADVGRMLWFVGNRATGIIATEVWDFDASRAFGEHQVELARTTGALVQLQFALNFLASNYLLAGEISAAAALIEEDRAVAEATGSQSVSYTAMLLAALRGDERAAQRAIAEGRARAAADGQGRIVTFADYSSAVLDNGLARYDSARDAARRVFERDVVGGYQVLAVAELAEAASRTGDSTLLAASLDRMSERARATPTELALGIEARLRALAGADDEPSENHYRVALAHLGRTPVAVELARTHLLYGEWLRREGRRVDAREQLRTAYQMLSTMGLAAFAERAGRELSATGETVRKRVDEARADLTAQEKQIVLLVNDGLSNVEIGTRLFLSPRTIEWHLSKVFAKLGVRSRKQLRQATGELAML
jgi:DNA-binding CsgD family transcriptional regulator